MALAGAGLGAWRALLHYSREIEPDRVEVRALTLTLPRLDPAFDGYRLLQISDIHFNHWMTPARFAGLVRLINAQRADLIAFTGDLVKDRRSYDPAAITAVLKRLTAADGVVGVMGNHDQYGNLPVLRRVLADSGIRELRNSVHTLRRGSAVLHLAGVDDIAWRQARLDLVLRDLPPDGAAILLAHEPDFADVSAATGRFDLQLSGHTHGGQVALPLVGPFILPKHGVRYPSGLYFVDGMYVYTNRGLGVGNVRVRLNCRPEITVLTLRSGAAVGNPAEEYSSYAHPTD
jgi:predicted MPP superfamily phosphohydrolase